MIELGKRDEIFGANLLKTIQVLGRPTCMPRVPEGSAVVCGYEQGLGERIIVCETVEDMQILYDGYAKGGALTIKWYSGVDPGFVTIISGGIAPGSE